MPETSAQSAPSATASKESKPVAEKKAEPLPPPPPPSPPEPAAPPEPATPAEPVAETPAPLMPKARYVNSRMAGYKAVAREVIERSNNNPLAVMAQAYFNDPSPTPHKTDTLITRLLENVKPEEAEIKRLSRDMKKDLVTAIVCYYLDKISFDHKDSRQIKQSNKTFEKLRKAKIGIQNIYEDWNGAEVKKYEPGVDLDALHELVTGVKK